MSVLDLQAMALALAACWVAPSRHLNRHKPHIRSCTTAGLVLLVSAAIGLQVMQAGLMRYLTSRDWFQGGNGTSYLVKAFVAKTSVMLPMMLCHAWNMFHNITVR